MSYSAAFSQSISIMSYVVVGSNREDCKYLSIKNISNKLAIPIPSIKRIIGMLKKNGLLETKSGVDGGLALSRAPQEISLLDIFNAVEGVNPLFKIYDNFNLDSFGDNRSGVIEWLTNEKHVLNMVENNMLNELKNINLSQLIITK